MKDNLFSSQNQGTALSTLTRFLLHLNIHALFNQLFREKKKDQLTSESHNKSQECSDPDEVSELITTAIR